MLKLLFSSLFFVISFILYCCIHVTTTYDKEINDIEQEKFLKARKRRKI